MSKEQTPIEELRLEIIKHLPNNPNAVFDIMSNANKVTQAKVLEALEPTIETLEGWLQDLNEGHYLKPYRLEDEIEYLKNTAKQK